MPYNTKTRPVLFRTSLAFGSVAGLWTGVVPTLDGASLSERKPAFVIICFPAPPESDNRPEHYQAIRRANFNVVLPSYRYKDEQQLEMLDHCRATGLRGVVNVKRLAPPTAEGPPPGNWPELVQATADRFGKHASLYGYMIREEPNAALLPQLGRVADEFRRLDPTHDICVNLFPVYATTEQLGKPSYEAHLEAFLRTVEQCL